MPEVILSVVGARPNFVKLAPVCRALAGRRQVRHLIVHTGQHYDAEMSDAFFRDLGVPQPDWNLGVGSGSHARQTAQVMERLEPVMLEQRPDVVMVYGDVNSTLAAALVGAKLGVKIGHVEAGLRSHDWTMPEEINRIVTDRVADLLFTPSRDANDNLRREGVSPDRIHFVGNVMIDSLVWALPRARRLAPAARLGLATDEYVLATLHRPSNVDDPGTLGELLRGLADAAGTRPVIFPLHPRTRARIQASGFEPPAGLHLINPVSYLEMVGLVADAKLVITDSGGVQEETTYLGIPCFTVRPNTERPITCREGTNRLIPPRRDAVRSAALDGAQPSSRPPVIDRWDGKAAERIVAVLCDGAELA
ncbi:MAG TPA: UDP-N-acetylglucosamine 2-epimerase (non-hydrolyzing) [Gemmatimonadales bacterium]|nr:UDP-N-acetylglucosamine 2-epimerase (non-hydrolyzing) [Gemmatimonadales bacterium]